MLNLAGKNAICVGGTSGIGQGIALRLAKAHANVVIVGRNAGAGDQIVQEMKKIHPSGVYSFVSCDATLMKDIKKTCEGLNQSQSKIDYLVLSQGIASMNGYSPTEEGIDRKLALHYYGRMMFIRCLLPSLNKALTDNGDARVLSVLSGNVHSGLVIEDDLELKNQFTIPNAANVAGTYNDLGLDQYAINHPKIAFNHASPGFVKTQWGSEFPWILRGIVRCVQVFAMTPEQCAENMCKALWNEDMKGHGQVIIMKENGGLGSVTPIHSERLRTIVWEHTNKILDKFF